MQLDCINSPGLSWFSKTMSDLARVMKNPMFSHYYSVAHYAKMLSHHSPRWNKASTLNADVEEPTGSVSCY
jgi:hypothetical protein